MAAIPYDDTGMEAPFPPGEDLDTAWAAHLTVMGHTMWFDGPIQWVSCDPSDGATYLATSVDVVGGYERERTLYVRFPADVFYMRACPHARGRSRHGSLC
jgi:hypothetical protein